MAVVGKDFNGNYIDKTNYGNYILRNKETPTDRPECKRYTNEDVVKMVETLGTS